MHYCAPSTRTTPRSPAHDPIRALILAACCAAETAASASTAEQLVRETLQATHQLTDEQAIELAEDIAAVMGVEHLNPQGAWRLIVARLGGIHHLPARLTVLTRRHRAKLADAGRGTSPADRFIVSPWHGEGRSVFYVVDSTAPEDSQPHVVADYPDRESADRHATALNLAEGMASGRVPLTTRQTS
jgi:hypothetical protein